MSCVLCAGKEKCDWSPKDAVYLSHHLCLLVSHLSKSQYLELSVRVRHVRSC